MFEKLSEYSGPHGFETAADIISLLVAALCVVVDVVSLLYSVLVCISVCIAPSTVFHSINSPDDPPLFHSVFQVCFCLVDLFNYISLCESLLQP